LAFWKFIEMSSKPFKRPESKKLGIAVGLGKGFIVTPRVKRPRPSQRKGHASERVKTIRAIIREVAGLAPYEKRIMEILKGGGANPNKRAWRFAKTRLGTHSRAKRKVNEMTIVNQALAQKQAVKKPEKKTVKKTAKKDKPAKKPAKGKTKGAKADDKKGSSAPATTSSTTQAAKTDGGDKKADGDKKKADGGDKKKADTKPATTAASDDKKKADGGDKKKADNKPAGGGDKKKADGAGAKAKGGDKGGDKKKS